MLHLLSSVVLVLIAAGVRVRHGRPRLHIRLMMAAFIADLLLVLYIEGTRHAVETVVRGPRPMIWFHAAVSVLVLAAYVAQLMIGRRMLGGRTVSRRAHAVIGVAFVGLRSLNYVTSVLL